MKIVLENFNGDIRTSIRRLGYAEIRDKRSGQTSYIKRLSSDHYPRFHIYIEQNGGNISFNLHLDQKKPSYQGQKAHSGEYDSEIVITEAESLKQSLMG